MPPRVNYIPTHPERTAMHKLRQGDFPLAQLGLIGMTTIDKMIAKGWILRLGWGANSAYRITPAGEAALKEKIPSQPRKIRMRDAEIGLKVKK